jgi:predicted nuclease of predicted toxin-antitoxin system
VWGPTATALRVAGHDVDWVGDWPSDPGDRAILERAHAERRILVTLDNDFGELAVRQGVEHSGIVRLSLTPATLEADICLQAITAFGSELIAGGIVTASPQKLRLRRARQPDDR